jgi:hypothetical protein
MRFPIPGRSRKLLFLFTFQKETTSYAFRLIQVVLSGFSVCQDRHKKRPHIGHSGAAAGCMPTGHAKMPPSIWHARCLATSEA